MSDREALASQAVQDMANMRALATEHRGLNGHHRPLAPPIPWYPAVPSAPPVPPPPPLVTSVRRMGRERRRAFDVWILCTHPPTRSSVHVFTYYHLPTHVLSSSHPHTAISLIRSRVFSTIHYPLSATHHPPPTLCIERRASCPSTYRL